MSLSDWNLVFLPNIALLRAVVSYAYVKQNMDIRSKEKSIPKYLVLKPFDQVGRNVKRDVSVRCASRPTGEGGRMENITPPMPAKRALATLDLPAPADVGPPKRISKKVRAAIDAVVSGD
jgi:hypothetical protein